MFSGIPEMGSRFLHIKSHCKIRRFCNGIIIYQYLLDVDLKKAYGKRYKLILRPPDNPIGRPEPEIAFPEKEK